MCVHVLNRWFCVLKGSLHVEIFEYKEYGLEWVFYVWPDLDAMILRRLEIFFCFARTSKVYPCHAGPGVAFARVM